MFCPHCQTTIEQGLCGLDGVQTVSVSYQTGGGILTIRTDQIGSTASFFPLQVDGTAREVLAHFRSG